jgi:NADH:ubiquinone reductase (non-electrogenic)
VEVAAELYDLIENDLSKLYPDIVSDVKIRVVELMDHVLSTYDRAISNYTADVFKRNGIELVLNSRVSSVSSDCVTTVDKEGLETRIPFGACVWATGIAMNPLVKDLQGVLPEGSQTHFRSIVTDEYLRVRGAPDGSMFAIGDAATIEQQKALDKADELFIKGDADGNGRLSMKELAAVLNEASKEFPHLAEHARFLESKTGAFRMGGIVAKAFASANMSVAGTVDEEMYSRYVNEDASLDREQFMELLQTIDSGLRALPATAQVAKQEGDYLAELFASQDISASKPFTLANTKPFEYVHKGSLAYVGSDQAVMDVPIVGPVMGIFAGLAWRGFETFSQISTRNQILVATDWARSKIFGRDTSRV